MEINLVGSVAAVSRSAGHGFSKPRETSISLIEGLGVEGDAHMGVTVKHRSRVARDPSQPNLRQVHLMHSELHEKLRDKGFSVAPGDLGENITTTGIDLLGLPTGAMLHFGKEAVVEVTGLRNPCKQLDDFQQGLMSAVLGRDADGRVVRKAGIMGIVVRGGPVGPDDAINVVLPDGPLIPLGPV